jgi:predicted pyridoxine 5'-phosphate oxidase superfamily flavin-nucleotide-binding protein
MERETGGPEPFHSGEREMQERTGERDVAARSGRLIADRLPAAAAQFVARQLYCVLGWRAPGGDLWAALLAGPHGFARTDEERTTVHLRLSDGRGLLSRIPPFRDLHEGDQLGTLFIELAARRRLRVNGHVTRFADGEISVEVRQAFPLCSKYIQRRQLEEREQAPQAIGVQHGTALHEELIAWITRADTFFVASAHPDGAADVSHRGGKPGFVRVASGALRIPDYPGNGMFNTLGNFALHPRAGLVFVDFETNRQLQMTGDVRVEFESRPPSRDTGNTGRWWEFTPREWVVSPLNRTLAWTFIDESPFNP